MFRLTWRDIFLAIITNRENRKWFLFTVIITTALVLYGLAGHVDYTAQVNSDNEVLKEQMLVNAKRVTDTNDQAALYLRSHK